MIHERAEQIKVINIGKLKGTKQQDNLKDLKIMEDVKGIKNGKVVK